MAYIITSKTRARIMSQPKERAKLFFDRRSETKDKHKVENVIPVNGMSEIEIHKEMDKEGSGIKESMIAAEERNAEKTREKKRQQQQQKQKIIKERVSKLEARDRSKGILKQSKRRK